MTRIEQMTRACNYLDHPVPRIVFKKDTIPAVPGTTTHADLLRRVGAALGADEWRKLAWTELRPQVPPPPPDQWGNRRASPPRLRSGWSVGLALVDGCQVVAQESTLHEEVTWNRSTRHWYTYKNRVLAPDLEDFADELGVLGDDERLAPAPACSRCRCREVKIDHYGYYGTQCERCTTWSRTTRKDRNRCADCRQTIPDDDRHGSRCNRCHGCRQDRAAQDRRSIGKHSSRNDVTTRS